MSCRANVVVVGEPSMSSQQLDGLADHATGRLHQLEQRWSRFLPTSELSQLNGAEGTALQVSPDTVQLVVALVQSWHATQGAFDPSLIGALVELGYAHSRDDIEHRTSLAPSIDLRGRPDDVLVDAGACVVRLPVGTALDPGGLGKGLAADIVTSELLAAGARGALVEIGGDLRATGDAPTDDGWTIEIDTATTGEHRTLVSLMDGGVATSTPRLRTWAAGGEHRHHLIHPTTLRPSTVDAVSCTVIAGTAAWAEAFTKVAFALAPRDAIERFATFGLAASITSASITPAATAGERLVTPAWTAFER
jgi:FAD:protein FMN transferase